MRSKVDPNDGHIIITGTGRTGTTFLVQLFTALGFDTGFSITEALRGPDSISSAGLEFSELSSSNPYVTKSPWYTDQLEDVLAARAVKLHAAILPMRRLCDAAQSRRRVFEALLPSGRDAALSHAGTLWHTTDPDSQEQILAGQFYKALYPLVAHGVTVYLMDFPRHVQDTDYAYGVLSPLMAEHGVSHSDFAAAHRWLADPAKVHQFDRKAS